MTDTPHSPRVTMTAIGSTIGRLQAMRAELPPGQAAALEELLTQTFQTQTTAHWVSTFEHEGFVISPVNTLREVLTHPQVEANDMIVTARHEKVGAVKLMGVPMSFEAWPLSPRLPPPVLGRHTEEVLGETGYTSSEIAALRSRGVI